LEQVHYCFILISPVQAGGMEEMANLARPKLVEKVAKLSRGDVAAAVVKRRQVMNSLACISVRVSFCSVGR
jgi:hypothetical protein